MPQYTLRPQYTLSRSHRIICQNHHSGGKPVFVVLQFGTADGKDLNALLQTFPLAFINTLFIASWLTCKMFEQ